MAEKPPIYFGMPLRSAVTTKNWDGVSQLFRNTIRAIAAQTDPDIHILVACHEQPDMLGFEDPRLEFLPAENPRPHDMPSQVHDQSAKLRQICREIARRGGGYFVLMDADDLISNRMAAFLRADDNRRGYFYEEGYILNVAGGSFEKVAPFWKHCGTCAVFWLTPEDLDSGEQGFIARLLPPRMSHHSFPFVPGNFGRPLEPLPFPGAVYLRHHGHNRSVERRRGIRLIRTRFRNVFYKIAGAMLRRPSLPADIVAEFAIPDDLVARFGRGV